MSAHAIGNDLSVRVHTFSGLNSAERKELLATIKPAWDQFEEICDTSVEYDRIELHRSALQKTDDGEDNPDHVIVISLYDYLLGFLLAKEQMFSLPEDMPTEITTDVKKMSSKHVFDHNKSMRINLMCARQQSGVGTQLVEVCKGLGRTRRCASLHLQAIPSAFEFYKHVGFVPYQEKEVACWEKRSDSHPFSDKFGFAIETLKATMGESFPEADAMAQADVDKNYDTFKKDIDAPNRIILVGIEKSRLVNLNTIKKWVTVANFKAMLQLVTLDVFSLLHPDTIPMTHCLIDTYKSGQGSGGSGGGSGSGSASGHGILTDAEKLEKYGFVVLDNSVFKNPRHKNDLLAEALKFPEFLKHSNHNQDKKYVFGGFAALGNPASYHNPIARRIRQWAMGIVVPRVFKPLIDQTGIEYNVEQYISRITIRVPGEKASPESYHRDESKYADGDDRVFGGWINLDDKPQWFHCVPKTHMPHALSHRGFSTIAEESKPPLVRFTHRIEIPPGHILVFYENIIHTVVGKMLDYTLVRVHLGWRLTTSTGMREEVSNAIENQAVPMIKSGQRAPMYSPMHIGPAVSTAKLLKWSEESFKPQCLEEKTWMSGPNQGKKYKVVHKYMKSLREYGFPMYAEYSADERNMYQPSNSWKLLRPGSDTDKHRLQLR